jgi:hypothetical protein
MSDRWSGQGYSIREDSKREGGQGQARQAGFNPFRRFGLPPPERPSFSRWDVEGSAQEGRSNASPWAYNDQAQEEGFRRGPQESRPSLYPGQYSDVSTSGEVLALLQIPPAYNL